jgi:hypothetical protein
MVIAHTVTLPRLHLPHNTTVFVGHCDINRSGLHWCLSAFDQAMTGHAVAYGKWPQHGDLWPENATEQVRQQSIYTGLKGLCDTLARTIFTGPVRLGLLLIDLGYERDVVHRFCNQARYSFRVLPSGGRASHKYYVRKVNLVGRPFEGCHVEKATSGAGHYMVFNADQWRETSQRAFLSAPGAPGGYTLHAVEDPRQHRDFANQVVAEKLHAKGLNSQSEMRWEWRHAPGNAWDWGDALTGCWVAAAASGLSASGTPMIRKKYVEKRKALARGEG